MPTVVYLRQGAERVLPVTVRKFEAGEVQLESLRVTRFLGTKMVLASGPVTSSKGGNYICQAAFYGVNDPNAGPSVNDNAGVRCGCQAYRFWFADANRKAGASHGARFAPYVRKTHPDDPRYPPKNPDQIPGACKHLLTFIQALNNSDFFVEKKRRK